MGSLITALQCDKTLQKTNTKMMELDFEDVESYLKSIEVGDDGHQQMYQVEMMIGDQVPMLSPQVTSSFSMPVEDLYSPYDTKEFPTSLDELLKMEELDVFVPINQNNNNYSQYKDLEVKTETLYVPVIQVSQYEMSQDNSHYTSSSDSDDDYVQPNRLSVRKSRKASGSSTASCQDSESEDEWRPEAEDYSPARKNTRRSRRSSGGVVKHTQRRKSKSFSHRPIPQKRSPGTSLKITQWIVSLLRDPMYNPSVITWADETEGVFSIRDTIKLASLWGEVKRNPEMNYEKLSRAMRYSYNNGELEPIREQRLTYKFGPSMTDWEALDRSDPNFEQSYREQ